MNKKTRWINYLNDLLIVLDSNFEIEHYYDILLFVDEQSCDFLIVIYYLLDLETLEQHD